MEQLVLHYVLALSQQCCHLLYTEEYSLHIADRFERMNNRSANDGENNQVPTSRNVTIADHGHALGSNVVNENPQTALIPLQGCCKSEACELLNDRMFPLHYPFCDSSGLVT